MRKSGIRLQAIATMVVAFMLAAIGPASAATVSVNELNLGVDWIVDGRVAAGAGAFVSGPAGQPYGPGSFQLATNSDADTALAGHTGNQIGVPLSAISSLSYCTYRDASSTVAGYLILVCSSLARDSFVEAGVDANRIAILPLGVNLDRFHPGLSQRIVRYRARFDLCSLVMSLLRKAWTSLLRLAANWQEIRFRLSWLWPVLMRIERHLIEELRRYGELIGRVSNGELGDVYRRASCLVLPSRFDLFGQVVVEAMACGLPVIVSENVGARDLVESGTNGWVIPLTTPAHCIVLWLSVRVTRKNFGQWEKRRGKRLQRTGWSVYRDRAAQTIREFLQGYVPGTEENKRCSGPRLSDCSLQP